MNPFIVFLRSDWLEWGHRVDAPDELKEQTNIAVMDAPIFRAHVKAAFEAGMQIATDRNNAYSAPELLLEAYMKATYE